MHLHQRYGQQAAAQIAQLQSQQGQQRVPQQANLQAPQQPSPYIKQEFKQEFKGDEPNNPGYPQQNYNSVPIKTSQVDGAADAREEYDTEIAQRRSLVSQHGQAGDRLIRDHVQASQQSLEGGGLLLPLEDHRQSRSTSNTSKSKAISSLARAQGDAAGDEDDEDAINSDLDDPDELDDANADDDNVSNVMLCTYDKVQRVKNKWKCTLKDGVLKVDGAE